ncbi:MAG TPA: hypothetical protein VFE34_20180 [Dongiaceae bacterium]|jgi:hypothetical protein|nr:hypothetical protein [Dongiaceae bacterium]
MSHRQEGLPATSLFLLATALLLFGVGGGLVGYMAGERQGEQRAAIIVRMAGNQWEAYRGDARSRFGGAIGEASTLLEKAAADLKAEVSMYHGCGAICNVIAYQFGEELLHTRDKLRKTELPALTDWKSALQQGGVPLDTDATTGAALAERFSRTTVIVCIALLCTTVALCFGIACFTVLKLRAAGTDPA